MNLNVRVNPGSLRDEVFVTSDPKDENYVNRTIYAKPGLFTSGEFSAQQIEDLEKQSVAELAKEGSREEAAPIEFAAKEPAGAAEPKKDAPEKIEQTEEE